MDEQLWCIGTIIYEAGSPVQWNRETTEIALTPAAISAINSQLLLLGEAIPAAQQLVVVNSSTSLDLMRQPPAKTKLIPCNALQGLAIGNLDGTMTIGRSSEFRTAA